MALVFKTPKTAINTTTRDMQNLSADCPPCPPCPEVKLTTADVEYTENGKFTIIPAVEYDGFSKVDVSVNIDTQAIEDAAYAEGVAEQKAKLTSTTLTTNGTVMREDGWNEVTVAVPSDVNNQDKTVSPTTSSQSVTADSGYSGLGTVTVNPVTAAIDQNIQASNIKNGVSILGVEGTAPVYENVGSVTETIGAETILSPEDYGYDAFSEVTVIPDVSSVPLDKTITSNGSYTYSASEEGGDYFEGEAYINVNVQPTLQAKTATPTTSQQVITADSGSDGLSQVTVEGVTSAIDANIQPENILQGITILGVDGTDQGYQVGYDEGFQAGQSECPTYNAYTLNETITENGTLQFNPSDYCIEGTVDPETGECTIADCFDQVNITVNVPSSGSNCPDWSSIGWDCNDVTASGLAADVAYAASVTGQSTWANDKNLIFVPVHSTEGSNGSIFRNCTYLRYCNNLELTASDASFYRLFERCSSLKSVGDITAPNVSGSISADNMFNECSKLESVGMIGGKISSVVSMFSSCSNLKSIHSIANTELITSTQTMFNACTSLTSVPLFNTSNVRTTYMMFSYCESLTNLSGFTNLGKAFVSTDVATYHTLDLSASTVLTKESIMNVINNLAAPDDTAVTNATLKLSGDSYALLTAEDIAIATAKNWSVVYTGVLPD